MAIEVRVPTILRNYTGGAKIVEGSGDTLIARALAGERCERIALRGLREHDARIGMIERGKEGEPLHMVPVQVREQDRSDEGSPRELAGQRLQSGAGVEDQGR